MEKYTCKNCKDENNPPIYPALYLFVIKDVSFCCSEGMKEWYDNLKVVDKLRYKDEYDIKRMKMVIISTPRSKNIFYEMLTDYFF